MKKVDVGEAFGRCVKYVAQEYCGSHPGVGVDVLLPQQQVQLDQQGLIVKNVASFAFSCTDKDTCGNVRGDQWVQVWLVVASTLNVQKEMHDGLVRNNKDRQGSSLAEHTELPSRKCSQRAEGHG